MTKSFGLFLVAFAAGACAARPDAPIPDAHVEFRNLQGQTVGLASAFVEDDGIRFVGTVRSLPAGSHGFHVHTAGRCEPPFESAGGHFNPTTRQHGTDNPNGAHVGDLPNLRAGRGGEAAFDVTARGAQLSGEHGLLDSDGAALIIHADPDDMRTDPAGNAGSRIVCGVVVPH
jgi:superoxide dismutase, Cu-Zn family